MTKTKVTNSEEHLEWSFEEIQSYLSTLTNYRHVSTNLRFMKQNIIQKTRWLDEFYQNDIPFSLRANAIRDGIFSVEDIPVCKYCDSGNKVRFLKQNGSFSESCSASCSHRASVEKAKKKSIETYGTEYHIASEIVKKKSKDTIMEKYGVDHACRSEKVRSKTRKTNIERYGGSAPVASEEVREKARRTNMEKYGVEHTGQSDEVKSKIRRTNMERYGDEHFFRTEAFKEKIVSSNINRYGKPHHTQRNWSDETVARLNDKQWLEENYNLYGGIELSNILGVDDTTIYNRLHSFGIPIKPVNQSASENQINSFVESLGFETVRSDRSILGGKELDIVIPEKKIAIEFNGLFWHTYPRVAKNYHLEKTENAKKAGYRLIHIFEDEWKYRKEQVKLKLMSILGVDNRPVVFARKCSIVDLSERKKELKSFYDENHIQGSSGYSVSFALEYEGDIVACMSFRKRSAEEYELNRYATSKRVVGGFSKLLNVAVKYFRNSGILRLVSFADIRYSDGRLYETTGWEHVKTITPDYQYVVGDKRVRKQQYRRKYLHRKLDHFDQELSEMDNMINNAIFPIFDCGLMKFCYDLPTDK